MKRVVITGPESSGKTTLTKELADYFQSKYYPEYARTYVESLNREYTYEDVKKIARQQIIELTEPQTDYTGKFIFYDTGLIITKIWFEYKFNSVPDFLLEALKTVKIDCWLLCYPDLPWKEDSVRENGGEKRFELFERYKHEAENYKFNWFIIRNKEKQRFLSAEKYLSSAYCL